MSTHKKRQMLIIQTLKVIKKDQAGISDTIRVDWGGQEPDDAIGELNEQYLTTFDQVEQIALTPYMLICIEWLYLLLRGGMREQEKRNFEEYIFATWGWWYSKDKFLPPYYNLEDTYKNTTNAIAVEFVISTFWDGIMAVPGDDVLVSAGMITQICEYCLPKESGFHLWKDVAGARLIQYFPRKQAINDKARTIPKKFFELEVDPNTIEWCSGEAMLASDPDEAMNRYLPLTLRED